MNNQQYPKRAHVGNEMIDGQLGAKRRVGYNHVTSASGKINLLKTVSKYHYLRPGKTRDFRFSPATRLLKLSQLCPRKPTE